MTIAIVAVVLSILSVGIFVLRDWPHILFTLTESESAAIPIVARLNAEAALRTSTLSALAGLVATAVAVAALRQAALARLVHVHQKALDWSKTYAEAANLLSKDEPTAAIAGVVGLRLLVSQETPNDSLEMIATTLASFVRNNRRVDNTSTRLALDVICNKNVADGQSLNAANLSNMNLSGLSFHRISLDGATFRGSTISQSQREYITNTGADIGKVQWSDD